MNLIGCGLSLYPSPVSIKRMRSISLFCSHQDKLSFMTDTSSPTLPPCPECSSEYTYEMPPLIVCPECAHEFSADAASDSAAEGADPVIVDSVGNALADGDTVTITTTLRSRAPRSRSRPAPRCAAFASILMPGPGKKTTISTARLTASAR